jgi:hypothetical protein
VGKIVPSEERSRNNHYILNVPQAGHGGCTPVILALGKLRQRDEFEASLGETLSQKKTKRKNYPPDSPYIPTGSCA